MGVKWFLCTQSLWKNDTERSFFAVLLSVVFLCLKVIIKLNFRHIAIGWVTPHRWKIHFRQLCREAWFPPWVFLFVPWDFCLCRGVFVCAVEFLFVPWQFLFVPWNFCLYRDSFCLCRGVFVCAVAPVGHRTLRTRSCKFNYLNIRCQVQILILVAPLVITDNMILIASHVYPFVTKI